MSMGVLILQARVIIEDELKKQVKDFKSTNQNQLFLGEVRCPKALIQRSLKTAMIGVSYRVKQY